MQTSATLFAPTYKKRKDRSWDETDRAVCEAVDAYMAVDEYMAERYRQGKGATDEQVASSLDAFQSQGIEPPIDDPEVPEV
mmetsp:Transcript_9883/g.33515  ORF Transcript_9883/g.33515 Transcript_9883/m.33515 type:complete len:81 (-) Transcript_9883:271-513(-)